MNFEARYKTLQANVNQTLTKVMNERERRRAYEARTPYVLFRQRTLARGGGLIVQRERVGELSYMPASEAVTIDGRKVKHDERLGFGTLYGSPTWLAGNVRKPKVSDLRKLERLDAKINELRQAQRALLVEAFERGTPIPAAKLLEVGQQNTQVRIAGYRSNAKVPRL